MNTDDFKRDYDKSEAEVVTQAERVFAHLLEDKDIFNESFHDIDGEFRNKFRERIDWLKENLNTNHPDLINRANKLWTYLERLNDEAKVLFLHQPEKLETYLLYPHVKKNTPDRINHFQYNSATHEFYWHNSAHSTLYQLQYAPAPLASTTEWEEGLMTPVTSAEFHPGVGDWLFRLRGFNGVEFGEPSEVLDIYIGSEL